MDEQVKKDKLGRKGRLALALFALALILCAAALRLFTVRAG